MKYFYDTEFIDDGKTIDLISIGIVAEDGREYYAQNRECNFDNANLWVWANVIPNLNGIRRITGGIRNLIGIELKLVDSLDWKYKRDIANDLTLFTNSEKYGKPELWGYYSAYDHVALMQLFGAMIDKPSHLPMYTMDIKQLCKGLGDPKLPEQGKGGHHALADARWNKQAYEFLVGYQLERNR